MIVYRYISRKSAQRGIRTLTAAIAATLLIAGCGGQEPQPTPAEHKDSAYINAETPGVLSFESGDCFNDVAINEALGEEELNTVQCPGAQNEVFTYSRLDGDLWNETEVLAMADEQCRGVFEANYGSVEDTAYRVYGVPPTETTWANGDRDVMCVIYQPGASFEVDPLAELIQISGG